MFASPNRTPFTTTNSSLNNSPLKLIHKSGAKKGSLISAAALAALNSKKKDRDDSMNYTNENKSPNKSRSLANTGGFGREIVNNDFEIRSEANRKSPTKKGKHYDRYIPSRTSSTNGNDHTGTISEAGDLTHTSDLSASLGIDTNKRILSFFAEPPPASSEHSSLLASYSRLPPKGAAGSSSNAASAISRRRIATAPERVLDAPGLVDDYYLNLLDWSCTNLVAIGLAECVYIWNAETGDVNLLCSLTEENDYICSLKWSDDGSYLAVGTSTGAIQVYDIESTSLIRTMLGHLSRVPTLSWSGAILSSGCRTGDIWNSDVRVGNHRVSEMKGHRGEVCGLEWKPEIAGGLSGGGQGLLASGGNDNVVNVWDGRMTNAAKMSKTNHTAAVKALAWCPWTPHLLASGGGSSDRTIHFWNTTTSARLNSLVTPSQVTSLVFNPHSRELLSSHGIPDHQLSIWSYPSLEKVTDIPQAHETRILHSCLSPDGTVVATASSDENLKFWRVFDAKKSKSSTGSGLNGAKEVEEGNGIQKKGRTGIHVR